MGAVALFFVGLCVVVPLAAIWRGYVLSVLWGWFVVPIFGAPPLGIVAAIGVALVMSFLTHQREFEPENEEPINRVVHGLVWMAMVPLIALVVGWVVKGFM